MAEGDTTTDTNPVSKFIFWGNEPNVNATLRQRIALQMMQNKRPYPKTLGEGLSAIGDSLGDIGTARMLMNQDAASNAAAAAARTGFPQTPAAPGPTAALPPSVSNANASASPNDVRNSIAAMSPAVPGGPQTNPTVSPEEAPGFLALAGGPEPVRTGPTQEAEPQPDQRLAENTAVPTNGVATDIRPAPPMPPAIRQAPPAGMNPNPPMPVIQQSPSAAAQGVPQPQFGYVPPPEPMPQQPKMTPKSADELRAEQVLATHPGDANYSAQFDPLLKFYQDQRAQTDLLNKQKYDRDYADWLAKGNTRDTAIANQAKDIVSGQGAVLDAAVKRATGGIGLQTEEAKNSATNVKSLPASAQALRDARMQFNKGMFTGTNANVNLALHKAQAMVASWFGIPEGDPRIANTETFTSNIMPIVGQLRSATSGNANISDADINLALAAAAGKLTLDQNTFPRVFAAIERINLGLAMAHQQRVIGSAAGIPQAEAYMSRLYGLTIPQMKLIIPDHLQQTLREHPDTAAEFDQTFNTPGLADSILRGR